MKTKHIVMVIGVCIAGWLALFGDKTPSGSIAEPAERHSTKAAATASPVPNLDSPQSRSVKDPAKPKTEPYILALKSRASLMGTVNGAASKIELFGSQSWAPPPPPPPKPMPPPPPTAPPVPFTYLGKKFEDNVWEVYIARGEQTFLVREKTVIDNTYRIDAITPPTITFTYLPLHEAQTLIIGGID